MAGYATLCFNRLVFEHKWSLLIGMACEANRIPSCRRAQLSTNKATVGIVTIRALDESFFHAMVERHIELWLDFLMTGVTKGWLSFD